MLEQLRDATLGEYEILLELGSGGMATVYLAHDLQLDRKVAVKLMHPALLAGEDMVERFILEARTAAGLSHANIVPIYAVKVQEELLYFVMKYVEGRPLDSIIKAEAPLAPDRVRQIVTQVADALGYAHRHGVVHRDIKPANIIISTDGHPILADFGIAKVADRPGLTMTGATIGTPTYMSPEQCSAERVTGATDQYSLGVTAFEMLTGAPPFEAPSHMTIMMKQMSEPAPLVQGRAPDCPADLAAVIDRMLAKESFDRFATMEDVVETLHAGTVTSTHKVRTQLVSFALADPRREQLKRVSTPRSPIPTAARRSRVDDTGAPRSIRPLAIGAAVVILAAGALLVVNHDRDRAQSRAPVTTAPSPAVPAPGEPGPPAPRQEEPAAAPTVSLPVPPPSPPRTPPAATPEPRAAIPDRGARARAGERATIPDTAAGVTQHDQVAIATESVVAVSLDPASLALMSGESAGLAAHATGTSGRVLERPVEWSKQCAAGRYGHGCRQGRRRWAGSGDHQRGSGRPRGIGRGDGDGRPQRRPTAGSGSRDPGERRRAPHSDHRDGSGVCQGDREPGHCARAPVLPRHARRTRAAVATGADHHGEVAGSAGRGTDSSGRQRDQRARHRHLELHQSRPAQHAARRRSVSGRATRRQLGNHGHPMRDLRALLRPGQAAVATIALGVLLGSCTVLSDPTMSPVTSVRVTPDSADLPIGAAARLRAFPLDNSGAFRPVDAVTWTTSDAQVVAVNDTGGITGMAAGTATITATAGGIQGSARVRVGQTPIITLEKDSVRFDAQAGLGSPPPGAVGITNGGGLTLAGLTVGAIEYGAGASSWLVASLDTSVAPAILTLQAATGAITQAGTYSATIPIVAAGASNSPDILTAVLVMVPGPPATYQISAFAGNNQLVLAGARAPVAPTVLITDEFANPIAGLPVTFLVVAGGGTITGPTVSTDTDGHAAVGSWTVAANGSVPADGKYVNQLQASAPSAGALTFVAFGYFSYTANVHRSGRRTDVPVATARPISAHSSSMARRK